MTRAASRRQTRQILAQNKARDVTVPGGDWQDIAQRGIISGRHPFQCRQQSINITGTVRDK